MQTYQAADIAYGHSRKMPNRYSLGDCVPVDFHAPHQVKRWDF